MVRQKKTRARAHTASPFAAALPLAARHGRFISGVAALRFLSSGMAAEFTSGWAAAFTSGRAAALNSGRAAALPSGWTAAFFVAKRHGRCVYSASGNGRCVSGLAAQRPGRFIFTARHHCMLALSSATHCARVAECAMARTRGKGKVAKASLGARRDHVHKAMALGIPYSKIAKAQKTLALIPRGRGLSRMQLWRRQGEVFKGLCEQVGLPLVGGFF
jgi:hypothetical protein